jgi:hypothetical protein
MEICPNLLKETGVLSCKTIYNPVAMNVEFGESSESPNIAYDVSVVSQFCIHQVSHIEAVDWILRYLNPHLGSVCCFPTRALQNRRLHKCILGWISYRSIVYTRILYISGR